MLSELNLELDHFTKVIHRDTFVRSKSIYQLEDDHEVLIKEIGRRKMSVSVNS